MPRTTVPEGATASRAGYYEWYQDLLRYMLNHEWYTWFAKVISVGEFMIGLGLVVGALVGIAAFFGTLLNFSFIMAGTSSSNPVLFGLGIFLVLGWKVAGYFGLDRYLLPMLGTPWRPGAILERTHLPTDRPGHAMQA
jgi:thiosulfate dehydrogenase (quinone) large subunit